MGELKKVLPIRDIERLLFLGYFESDFIKKSLVESEI